MATLNSTFVCARCSHTLRAQSTRNATRTLATATRRRRDNAPPIAQPSEASQQLPRWSRTPPAMKMPIRLRPKPKQPEWRVNDDPEVLDEMYDRFIGRAGEAAKGQVEVESTRGRDLLPEEIKWLAVTHKSFDHARRGFNDRLAFLGKRIVDLQTSIALLNAPPTPREKPPAEEVFRHPALEGLENITAFAKANVLEKSRLAGLASSYGVDKAVRWKPKKSDNLQGSGVEAVLAHTMYSIIGALALQRGGEVAVNVTRDRILKPLGLR